MSDAWSVSSDAATQRLARWRRRRVWRWVARGALGVAAGLSVLQAVAGLWVWQWRAAQAQWPEAERPAALRAELQRWEQQAHAVQARQAQQRAHEGVVQRVQQQRQAWQQRLQVLAAAQGVWLHTLDVTAAEVEGTASDAAATLHWRILGEATHPAQAEALRAALARLTGWRDAPAVHAPGWHGATAPQATPSPVWRFELRAQQGSGS